MWPHSGENQMKRSRDPTPKCMCVGFWTEVWFKWKAKKVVTSKQFLVKVCSCPSFFQLQFFRKVVWKVIWICILGFLYRFNIESWRPVKYIYDKVWGGSSNKRKEWTERAEPCTKSRLEKKETVCWRWVGELIMSCGMDKFVEQETVGLLSLTIRESFPLSQSCWH